MRATAWTINSLAMLWLAYSLCAFSNVEVDLIPALTVMFSALALAGIWFIVACVLVVLLLGGRIDLPNVPWDVRLGLFSIPLAGAIFWGAVSLDLPFRARLQLSEGALEDFAEERLAESGRWTGSSRVGLFRVSEADVVDGCVRMITTGSFVDTAGLVWCGTAPAPTPGRDRYWHIQGRWWGWYRRF